MNLWVKEQCLDVRSLQRIGNFSSGGFFSDTQASLSPLAVSPKKPVVNLTVQRIPIQQFIILNPQQLQSGSTSFLGGTSSGEQQLHMLEIALPDEDAQQLKDSLMYTSGLPADSDEEE